MTRPEIEKIAQVIAGPGIAPDNCDRGDAKEILAITDAAMAERIEKHRRHGATSWAACFNEALDALKRDMESAK